MGVVYLVGAGCGFDESYTLRNPKISEDMKKEMKEKLEKSKIGYVV
mgnify:CR=1 FL=1